MNSLNSSSNVISNFILSGGLGYITYWILETSEIISSSKDTTRATFLSLLFSVPNYFLYSIMYKLLPNSNFKAPLVLLLTLASIALLAPPICKFLINLIFSFINLSIKLMQLIINLFMSFLNSFCITKWLKSIILKIMTGVSNGDPWTIINKSSQTLVYLYNFNKQLLTCGYGKAFETHADSISIKLSEEIENGNTDYDNVVKYTFEKMQAR